MRISYTADNGDTGWFDSEKATLIAADVSTWDGHNHISRATNSQWVRHDLYRTAGGVWMIHRENRDGRSAPVGADWFSLTPEGAEEWLRIQDLHDIADEHFGHVEEHIPGQQLHPKLHILDAGDQPVVTLVLPLSVARNLVEAVYRYVPANSGIDGAVVDELREQLQTQNAGH